MTLNKQDQHTVLTNMARLQVLRDLSLLDPEEDTIFDRLTALASTVIGAPVSLVSMVAANYQFFKSMVGLPEPWASRRQTPLSHSFCQHVVATDEPLIVTDARKVDLLKDNKAIPDLDVIGYLGMPLTLHDGRPLGSFCVIDSNPREWTQDEIDIMHELAAVVTADIDAKAHARIDDKYVAQLEAAEAAINNLINSLDVSADKAVFLKDLRAAREKFGI
jgi:GAF domain-containing protein